MTDRILEAGVVTAYVAIGVYSSYVTCLTMKHEEYRGAAEAGGTALAAYFFSVVYLNRFFPQEVEDLRGRISTRLNALLPGRLSRLFQQNHNN